MSFWSSFIRSACAVLVVCLLLGMMGFVMATSSEYKASPKSSTGFASFSHDIGDVSRHPPGIRETEIVGSSGRSMGSLSINGSHPCRPQTDRRDVTGSDRTLTFGPFREQLIPSSGTSRKSMVSGNGTVVYVEIADGFYGIVADDGSHYIPDTLPDSLKTEGTRIGFSGIVSPPEPNIRMWGSPLHLLRIEPIEEQFTVNGTVRYIDLEGGFYGIVADDGSHYLPMNLPEEFRVDNLRVTITARQMEDVNTIYMWGTVVRILSIQPCGEAQVQEQSDLSGSWTLVRYLDNGVATERIPGTTLTAEFGDDGTINGRSGCNLYFADYRVTGQALSIGDAGSTEMYCYQPEGTMEQEAVYLGLLVQSASFGVEDGELVLMDGDGQGILWFVQGTPDDIEERTALVEFRRTGGFAGFSDHLVVYTDGSASLTRKEYSTGFSLTSENLVELEDLLTNSGFSSLDPEYRAAPGSADLFTYEITYEGRTVLAEETAVPESLIPVIEALFGLVQESAPDDIMIPLNS
ncbi:MAG: META domain-containing protein [Methanolinea sp.]|nr:META domain-containing protein [Methanolinea sp.]